MKMNESPDMLEERHDAFVRRYMLQERSVVRRTSKEQDELRLMRRRRILAESAPVKTDFTAEGD
jgi:hypothetical protein